MPKKRPDYLRKKFLASMKKKGIDVKVIDHPLILEELSILRNRDTKNFYFKQGLRRMGELLTYELLREARVAKTKISTPLCRTEGCRLQDGYVVIPVLRAGLPIAEGFVAMMKEAEVGIISCWRRPDLSVAVEYAKIPSITGKHVIIIDPMLATGHTLCAVREALKPYGKPKSWTILAVISTAYGITELSKAFQRGTSVYTCALDDEAYSSGFISVGLNSHGYIVPGLGDAGDRIYGTPKRKNG
ncbi:MAG: uracil phosphoribosyltransferase [Candidatus Diapherotrites archaeon]|nr:uracil phosphoribosyltransferase [Candidatus Diapherotrites archaeon]